MAAGLRRQIVQARVLVPLLRGKLSGDTGAVVGTVFFLNLLRIGGTMIMTRLLNAEAFGVVGITTSVSVVFGLLSDIGIVAFVIRHERGQESAFLDEIWTLRMIRSLALTAGMAVFAEPIAAYLGKPELRLAIAVGGLYFLFDGASSMAFVTALRERLIKRLSAIDIVASVAGLGISIMLANLFHNYWAIIIAGLLSQTFRGILSYTAFPRSRRRWAFSAARMAELWSFARFITGSTIITLILGQTDKVVLSKVFTLDVFGLYILASNIATAPIGLANSYAARILYPHYSHVWRENSARLDTEYYRQRLLMSLLYAFAVGGLIGSAPLVIHILYDKRYVEAAIFLQLLSIASLFALNNYAMNEVMIATGRSYFTLNANIVRLLFLICAGPLAYHYYSVLGLVSVIGAIELAAQLYGWWALQRAKMINWRYETIIAGVSGAGIVSGLALNSIGLWLMG
jgi:lipopolysaccharide exporter